MQKLVESDVALFVAGNLRADAVVGNRAIDDVVVVKRPSMWLGAVVINEVCPLLSVGLEALVTELLEECLNSYTLTTGSVSSNSARN